MLKDLNDLHDAVMLFTARQHHSDPTALLVSIGLDSQKHVLWKTKNNCFADNHSVHNVCTIIYGGFNQLCVNCNTPLLIYYLWKVLFMSHHFVLIHSCKYIPYFHHNNLVFYYPQHIPVVSNILEYIFGNTHMRKGTKNGC